MTSKTRLARLEREADNHPVLTGYTPAAQKRAELARQRLPDCATAAQAEHLMRGQTFDVYCSLLRLVPDGVLIELYLCQLERARSLGQGVLSASLPPAQDTEGQRLSDDAFDD